MFQKKLVVWLIPLAFLYPSSGVAQQQPESAHADFAQLTFVSSDASRLPQSDGLLDSSSESSSSSAAYVQPVPRPVVVKAREDRAVRPFSALAVGVKADTLGAGLELATPLSRSFNLRASVNIFAFNYPFSIDGVYYDARLHFKSGQVSVDWFPRHRAFHISPGMIYLNNTLTAPSSVPAGQYFELGSQGFINSVDDPLTGTSSVVYPRKYAPMLTMGFGNLIPRSGRHFSVPFEFGVAYTGAARIDVSLNGTACTYQGCVTFANNADAQASLRQEIYKLNEDLKRVPVYPILSIGLAYRF
jgi:hypothetical protein